MAAVLSRNISDIGEITKFMDECKSMGIKVLSPDVNESYLKFTVNKEGNIRFGLGAVKGVGENAVRCIMKNGKKMVLSPIFSISCKGSTCRPATVKTSNASPCRVDSIALD